MQDTDTIQKAILNLIPMAILGKFAKGGMVLSCLFFVLNMFVAPLPFHPMYGFMLVPIGAVAAYLFGKFARVAVDG